MVERISRGCKEYGKARSEKKQLGEGSHRTLGSGSGRESQTYGRQAGSEQRRIIPTKSTKQSSRSRRDIFTNISR